MNNKQLPVFLLALFLCLIICGCSFTRVVYVSNKQAVRLRETQKNVKVWVKTKDGTVAAVTDLQEGWYCLPDGGSS